MRLVPKIPRGKRPRRILSEAEACSRAVRDHARAVGKKFVVEEVDGYVGDDTMTCGPAVIRVLPTSKGDICHTTDENHLDPYWDVEVVSSNDSGCRALRSTWVYGPTYRIASTKRRR